MVWIQDFDSTNLEIFIHVISRSHIIYHDIRNCKNTHKKDYFCSTKSSAERLLYECSPKFVLQVQGNFSRAYKHLLCWACLDQKLHWDPLPYYLVTTCPLNSDSYSMPLIRREIIIIINIYVHKALSLSFLCQLV